MRQPLKNVFRAGMVALAVVAAAGYSTTGVAASESSDASQIEAQAPLAAQQEAERVIVNEVSSKAAKLGREAVDASQIDISPAIQAEVSRLELEIVETGRAGSEGGSE